MLLLFDVDGTLVRTAGAGRAAMERAIEEVAGFSDALKPVRLDGNTDPQILSEAFARAAGREATLDEITAIYERYVVHLEVELDARLHEYQVLPGALRLIEAAVDAGYELGLATGNIEDGARRKLRPGDLDRHFAFGGFGSDAGERSELVAAAIGRSRGWPNEAIVVLGDTERDVHAARKVGVQAVGVLAGCSDHGRLRDAGPDLLAESFDDPALWSWLKLA
jgi:phosphoglycolate phosphatase-like HAD superfamily hydrolase